MQPESSGLSDPQKRADQPGIQKRYPGFYSIMDNPASPLRDERLISISCAVGPAQSPRKLKKVSKSPTFKTCRTSRCTEVAI